MKALKTIVATTVIVFAVTTVAMAGVHRLGGDRTDVPQAAAAASHATGSVTLTAHEFTALVRAVVGARSGGVTRNHAHARDHAHALAHTTTQGHAHVAGQASGGGDHDGSSPSGGSASGQHHDSSDGGHDGGSCGDGGHDGGCD